MSIGLGVPLLPLFLADGSLFLVTSRHVRDPNE